MFEPLIISGKPDEEKKSCYDCHYCQGSISLWCVNKEAVEYRGTQIPGVIECIFWKGAKTIKELNFFERIFSFLYLKIEGKTT